MPYYNLVDGHCYIVKEKDVPDIGLYDARKLIDDDSEFAALKKELKDKGLTIQVQVDSDICWLCVYLGKQINNDKHSYQGKIITFKKNDANHAEFEDKISGYDQRIESILNRLSFPYVKEVGIVFNQWD